MFVPGLRSHDQTRDGAAKTRTFAPIRPRPRRDGGGRKDGSLHVRAAQDLKP